MKEKRKNSEKVPNVPNLRFPGFDAVWEEKRLDKLAFIERGRFSPRPRNNPIYYGGNIPFVQTSDVVHSRGKIEFYSQTLNDRGLSVSKLFPKGAILITIAANIGYAGILQRDMACPDSLIGIKCKNETYNLFLNILLEIDQPKMDYLAVAAAQKNINIEFLKPYKFNLPSLPEQKKIAAFFSSINNRINTQNEIIEKYESLMKGQIQKIFLKELRFKDVNGNKFPEWEWKRGNMLFEAISNKNHNSDLPILAISQEFGAIPRELINYNISVTEKSVDSYKVIEKGDFIISLRSFQGGIEYSNYTGICSPAYIILRAKEEVNNKFYKPYFKTDYYIRQLCSKLEGIRDGKMISYKYFSEIKLPLPSLKEQKKIADFISCLTEKIQIEKQLLGCYQNQKKYFSQNLFI